MARVYVSIGSNVERERHIRGGVGDLRALYGALTLSSVYESAAVGFEGDDFYNLVAAFDTEDDVHSVARMLRTIEDRHGRVRGGPRFSSRTLDIDLLLYNDMILREAGLVLPREEIVKNAFVLGPLAEIAPEAVHPLVKRRFHELWLEFDKKRQPLSPVAMEGL